MPSFSARFRRLPGRRRKILADRDDNRRYTSRFLIFEFKARKNDRGRDDEEEKRQFLKEERDFRTASTFPTQSILPGKETTLFSSPVDGRNAFPLILLYLSLLMRLFKLLHFLSLPIIFLVRLSQLTCSVRRLLPKCYGCHGLNRFKTSSSTSEPGWQSLLLNLGSSPVV